MQPHKFPHHIGFAFLTFKCKPLPSSFTTPHQSLIKNRLLKCLHSIHTQKIGGLVFCIYDSSMLFVSLCTDTTSMSNTLLTLRNAQVYQREHLVLSDVNIDLIPGQFVYLIGETGSGKSSLLKTLYGDLPLVEGSGSIVGYDLRDLKEKEIPYLRRKIGIVFQDFQLLTDRNVHQNLHFVLKATGWTDKVTMEERINEVLGKVGMGTKGHKMPYQLSGGEQQRVAIARALLNDPDLILADEPTGNLDPRTSEEIMFLLTEICKNGRAILMATHDYSLILKFPNATWKVDNGTIYETIQSTL